MDYLKILLRIITILPLFLLITLLTGRRKIGELPVFDFLVILILGSVVGADIADPNVEHVPTAFAIVVIMFVQYIYSIVIIKKRKLGKWITFEPIVVIENGQFVKGNMSKLKYSIDNILALLREKGIFDLNEVEFAVIESTGQISVLKKSQHQPVTPCDVNLNTEYKGLSLPLIVEGEVYKHNLKKLGLNEDWLLKQLGEKNIQSTADIFFASINTQGALYITKGINKPMNPGILRH